MSNRVFVCSQEEIQTPSFFDNVEPFLLKVMQKLNYDNEECSVMLCNDDFIKNLNNEYRKIDSATDVLSFENDESYEEDGVLWKNVGDIVLSVETLPKNAKYFEVPENTELKRLLIHGLLHLNGFDHGEEHIEKDVCPECEMLKLQEELLFFFENEKLI